MKYLTIFFIAAFSCLASQTAFGQADYDTKADYISRALGVSVFPADGQDEEKQEYDEYQCYKWAIKNSGVNPGEIGERRANAQRPGSGAPKTGGAGAVIGKAAGGAALGALIGAIAGDAGKGAKIGAVAGGVAGIGGNMAKSNAARQQNQREKQQEEDLREEEDRQIERFKKSFCNCMDAKGYSAR